MAAKKEESKAAAEKKDPGIAALISAVGLLIVAAPAIGYFYIGNVKKGIEYLIAMWALTIGVCIVYFGSAVIGSFLTFGLSSLCCMPIFLVPLVFGLVILWDVYLEAKGEPTKLPTI